MKDSVYKVSKLVRMHPEPFVTASSMIFVALGVAGLLLEVVVPVSMLVFVSGMCLQAFKQKICEKIRWNPMQEMANEMSQLLEQVQE